MSERPRWIFCWEAGFPGQEENALVAGRFGDLLGRDFGIAQDLRQRETRAYTGLHLIGHRKVLVLGIALDAGLHLGVVEAVAAEQVAHRGHGGCEVGVVHGRAQVEARGGGELAAAGRRFDGAVRFHPAHKPLLGGVNHNRYTAGGGGLGLDVDIGVFAGGVEPLDGFLDFGEMERLAGLEGNHTRQIGARNRLLERLKANRGNGMALVGGSRREIGCAERS